MDAERARRFLLTLPHVVETMQWGDNLVFWVGDKAVGGKMFTLMSLDVSPLIMSFAAGPERYAELLEVEGFRPAPYFARLHWVAAERWDVLTARAWEDALRAAHGLIFGKLPRKTREVLLPGKDPSALILARPKDLATAAETAEKSLAKRTGKRQQRS